MDKRADLIVGISRTVLVPFDLPRIALILNSQHSNKAYSTGEILSYFTIDFLRLTASLLLFCVSNNIYLPAVIYSLSGTIMEFEIRSKGIKAHIKSQETKQPYKPLKSNDQTKFSEKD